MSREKCVICGRVSNYDMGCVCKNPPSKRYWDVVKTRDDYKKFIASGVAWEWEPNTPTTWADHEALRDQLFSGVK